MTALAEVFVTVRPDTDRFGPEVKKKLAKIDSRKEGNRVAARWGAGFNGAFGGIVSKSAGAFAAAFAGIKVGGFLKDAVGQASDLNETMSKSAAVFGPANKEIQKFAADAAKSLGQSKAEAIGAASSFGNLFVQLGIGQAPAAKMSEQMVRLATDFASFHNADITEVLEAQQAAFRGEYDSVQKFVPTLNAAAVEQEALRMKLAGSTKELTEQDKALATQSLLMKGAGKAAGDFSRTSGGLANQQRILKAQFADSTAELGTKLLPVATKFFTWLNQSAFPWVKNFVTSEGFTGFLAKVRAGAGAAFGFFKTEVLPRLQDFAVYIRETVVPIIVNLVQDRLAKLREGFGFVRDAIQENRPQLEQLGSAIQSVAKWIIEKLVPFLAKVSNETLPIVGRVIVATIDLISDWVDIFNSLKSTATSVVRTVWEKVSGFFGNLVEGAAKAFGWVPNLGPKLKTAAAEFGRFRDSVNEKLGGITDQQINFSIKYSSTGVNLTTPSSVGRRAMGGPIHGPGTGTSDTAGLFALSNGEHVWTAREVAAAGGHEAMERMRSSVLSGKGFAKGGAVGLNPRLISDSTGLARSVRKVVIAAASSVAKDLAKTGGGLAGTMAFGRSQAGKPYLWGGVGPNGYDCSGFVSALINYARGRNPYRRLGSTGTMPWGEFAPGIGRFMVGWFKGNPGHTAATINGVNFESRGGRGVVVGSGARGAYDSLFTSRAKVKGFAAGGAVGDAAFDLLDPRGKHFQGKQFLQSLGISNFDSGGRWRSGTLGVNMSGKTETVIPGDGAVRLDRDTIRDLARAMVDAARETPIMLDGKRVDEAMTRRALGSGGSIRY